MGKNREITKKDLLKVLKKVNNLHHKYQRDVLPIYQVYVTLKDSLKVCKRCYKMADFYCRLYDEIKSLATENDCASLFFRSSQGKNVEYLYDAEKTVLNNYLEKLKKKGIYTDEKYEAKEIYIKKVFRVLFNLVLFNDTSFLKA